MELEDENFEICALEFKNSNKANKEKKNYDYELEILNIKDICQRNSNIVGKLSLNSKAEMRNYVLKEAVMIIIKL